MVAAAAITASTGLFGSPATLAVAAPILAAAIMVRVPVVRERPTTALALLAVGWLGGSIGVALVEPRTAVHVSAALDGVMGDQTRSTRSPSAAP